MSFREWYEFNCDLMNFGDMYIKVFRKASYKNEDKCLEVLMRTDDAVRMFGSYNLLKITMHSEARECGDYKALCALLCQKEETA